MGSPFKKSASSKGGGDFENPPAGNHAAVLVAIIDGGTHLEQFAGKEAKPRQSVFFVWELTDCKMSGSNNNFFIGEQFTNSLNTKAKLAQMLATWRGVALKEGEEYDFTERLGKLCLVSINRTGGDSGDQYANFSGCSKPPLIGGKPMPVAAATVKPFAWAIQPGAKLDDLPTWLPFVFGKDIREVIKRSDEWIALCNPTSAPAPSANGKGSVPEEFPHGANAPAGPAYDESAY